MYVKHLVEREQVIMNNKKDTFGRLRINPNFYINHGTAVHIINYAGIGYHQVAGNMHADASVIYKGGGLDNKR